MLDVGEGVLEHLLRDRADFLYVASVLLCSDVGRLGDVDVK